VTKVWPFPMNGHYKMDIISSVAEVRLGRVASVMYSSCAISRASVLYYKSLGIVSTLLRMGNISGRLYY
jgi:hypothetical protein